MAENNLKNTAKERWENSRRGKNGIQNSIIKPWTSSQYSGSNTDYASQYEGALIYHNENVLNED